MRLIIVEMYLMKLSWQTGTCERLAFKETWIQIEQEEMTTFLIHCSNSLSLAAL